MISGVDHEYIAEDAPKGAIPPMSRPDVRTTYCEVMQMGACKLDEYGVELDVLNLTVKAHRIPEVPLWLSNMTGMTTERREIEGIPFPDAYEQLLDFTNGGETPYTFNGDWWVLEGNVRSHGLEMGFPKPFRRVKPVLQQFGVTLVNYQALGFSEMNSGNLHTVLGITLPSIEGVGAHDAAHDARSLIHSVHHLLQYGVL